MSLLEQVPAGGILTRTIKLCTRRAETEAKDLEVQGDGQHRGHEIRDTQGEPASTAETEHARAKPATTGGTDAEAGAGGVEGYDELADVPPAHPHVALRYI